MILYRVRRFKYLHNQINNIIAIQGSVGVEGVLSILKDELKITMQLAGMSGVHCRIGLMRLYYCQLFIGCVSLSDIKKDMVVHKSYFS